VDVICPCGETFQPRRANQRYHSPRCGELFRKRRQRGGTPVRPWTRRDVVENVDAALELFPADLAALEERHPEGEDPVIDELIGGLWTHVATLERLRSWLAGGAR
jgi:hypothetical protein